MSNFKISQIQKGPFRFGNLYSKYLKTHKYVALVQPLPYGIDQKFKIFGYDFFNQNPKIEHKIIMNHIWSNGNPFKKLEDAFTPLNRFHGNFEMFIDKIFFLKNWDSLFY